MSLSVRSLGSVAACALLFAPALVGAEKVKIKPSVTYAKSWDAAVAEGKLLNAPIVVHSHGFY